MISPPPLSLSPSLSLPPGLDPSGYRSAATAAQEDDWDGGGGGGGGREREEQKFASCKPPTVVCPSCTTLVALCGNVVSRVSR